ncbi:MAG TPA: histidine kinase dimerization/phospho-acceptor domain-containing protein [Phototrophicaceae bacterium]|nr:histidine kinase dimerization/phospho-acceptor domain-containing protein [Phototrophicaceae bacterium]
MKRILVIDESEVVRETLALILGREFAVSKRALGTQGFSFSDAQAEVDLLILGISPRYGLEARSLTRFAAQFPFAVLFLLDSKSATRAIPSEAHVGFLTKPFNPYELHEKVGQLLALRAAVPKTTKTPHDRHDIRCYLDYPYLSRSSASIVHRFASARLPLLIAGELGCGQDRVVSALCHLEGPPGFRLLIDAGEANSEYLAQKALQLSFHEGFVPAPITLVIHGLDRSSPSTQSSLFNFAQEIEEKLANVRYLSTASSDLLEKLYRGEFLESLYYKLATLTLKLSPLRERQEDIVALAGWFARIYGQVLGIGEPVISPEAGSRLRNYLWFGNLKELETVIARTVALRRKLTITADDLVFEFGETTVRSEELPDYSEVTRDRSAMGLTSPAPGFRSYSVANEKNGHVRSVDLNVLIHELAHEFKNPMVTIKTFAQLLGDRYQDENFRTRFQEVVGGDIERMDELLEMMIEFADFSQPQPRDLSLDDKLRAIVLELQAECAKRQTQFAWQENGATHVIRADEPQLAYILRNVLLATLCETKIGSEIRLQLTSKGVLTISHLRDEPQMASIGRYIENASSRPIESILPLRVLLAKYLLEKNGGRFTRAPSEDEQETLRMEFPIAEHGQEN